MGGEFSTDSKSFNGIEISWFIQVLSRFYWFGGVAPWGLGGWVGGWGWGWVEAPPTHMCMYARVCTYAHTCMHVKHDKHGCLHGGGHLQFPNMFILAFRACVCTCLGIPSHAPRCPPTHLPPPQSRREPKSPKVYKSWTNWDNSILFEKSLPLNIPELI